MNRPWLKHYDEGVPEALDYQRITLPEILNRTADEKPDFIATTFNDQDISYNEVRKKVNSLANALIAGGIRKGDRIALLLPNSPTYIYAFYAVRKAGAIVANLNVTIHGQELAQLLNHCGASAVITLDLFVKNVVDIVENTSVTQIIIHSVFGAEKEVALLPSVQPFKTVNDLVTSFPSDEPPKNYHWEDIAVLQYTSGVTGVPKAAVLTERSIVSNLTQILSWNPLPTCNRAVICIIPFFHVFGMVICLHLSVSKGYRMILFPMFDWSSIIEIQDAVSKYKPISFPAVPALWSALVSSSDLRQQSLADIDHASGGGSSLSVSAQEKYHALTGKYISQAYGLSEVSSTAVISPFSGGRISESIGIPLPDTDVRIVDIDTGTKECQPGETGEIIIRGPQLMEGYWEDEERTKRALRNGWLFTGDLGYMDEEGFFYLVDRLDDLIISSGFNVYPSKIEEVIIKHPLVKEVAVVGRKDGKRGESITAYIVPQSAEKPSHQELRKHCVAYLPEYQVPRVFKFREELPRNKLGKPMRRLLKEEK